MPQPLDISDRFVSTCSPVIGSTYPTCGTITKASIDYLTKDDLNELFTPGGKFADLQAWFMTAIEMKACGVKRNALYDWIMANADTSAYKAAVSSQKSVKGPTFLYPFIFGRQVSVVNRDYWFLRGNAAGANYTVNTTDAAIGAVGATTYSGPLVSINVGSSRVFRVTSRHGIPMDPAWFRDRDRIHVFNKSTGGVAQWGQWKVIQSAVNNDLTYIDVEVQSENSGSDQPFGLAMATGVIIPGVNNVNDYERWCVDLPTIDPRKRVPFWVQTWRDSRCVDSEYEEVFARLMTSNPAFKEFGDLDLAERNKQDEEENQRRFINSFFFNKPISQQQTLTLWESLEAIDSVGPVSPSTFGPGLSGRIQARRANFIGVKEQLRLCDRVRDLQNNPLNLYEWLDENYNIMRARKTSGLPATEITWFTNSIFAANFVTAVMQYYKQETLEQFRITAQLNQVGELGWTFSRFEFKRPAGVKINILTDPFFDDFLDEMTAAGHESAGNLLLALDIGRPGVGTIYYALIASLRKTYKSAEIDELARLDPSYRCVMKYPTTRQNLHSQTGTVIVECPLVSSWIENFNNTVPVTTGRSANPQYYNLY